MKITSIEDQKKNKNRKSVFLDGAFAFGIDAFSLYALKLKEGDEISPEALAEIKHTVLFEDAKAKAAKLLSSRSYTRSNMQKKLTEYTGDPEITDKTLGFLEEYKLIDDHDYARRYAHDCYYLKKLGKRSIRMKLAEKGIPASIADEVIEALTDEDETESHLLSLLSKKLGANFDFKNIQKAKRYAAYRGYSFDEIDAAIRKLSEESEVDASWQPEDLQASL